MAERCVLAYSGGLDTSVAIRWLAERKGLEVVALALDVGQESSPAAATDPAVQGSAPGSYPPSGACDPSRISPPAPASGSSRISPPARASGPSRGLEDVRQRALECGAVDALVIDARDEFAEHFVAPAIKANALYMGKYPLVSALSRPLIVHHLVRVAREVGSRVVAHGCTGKGNDQVRFEVGVMCLAPDLRTEAPIREWGLSRDEAIAWANERGLPIPVKPSRPYSIDENLWGRAAECGVLEDPWQRPPDDVFARSRDARSAPDEPEELLLRFEDGLPVAVDGKELALPELVSEVDRRAGAHGVGRIDMVEDRLVGIKSREVYECPGAVTLLVAHRDLEDLCLEQELAEHKRAQEGRYAQLIYNGLWWGPLKRALDAFMAEASRYVAGEVRVELYKGNATVVGRRSQVGLYDETLATYSEDDRFDHSQAEGFVKLWGLPLKTWARRMVGGQDLGG